MLSVSALSFLHQFIFCQSGPLPIRSVSGECRGMEKCEDRLFRETRPIWLPNASNTFRIMLLTQCCFCEVCVEKRCHGVLSLTLEITYPAARWHGENKAAWAEGAGTPLPAGSMVPFSSGVRRWSITLLVGSLWTRYCSKIKKGKKNHYPYKSDFKISVNSPLGSKKHISKQ